MSFISKIIQSKNFLSLAGNIIYAALGFVSFVILTRTYSKNDFGQWMLFLTCVTFSEMLRFGVTRTGLVRFLSGSFSQDEKNELIGSNWIISIAITLIFIFLIAIADILFFGSLRQSNYILFFIWYPLFSIVSLPFNNSISVLQAAQMFSKIILLRLISMGTFVLFNLLNLFVLKWSLISTVIAYLISFSIASLVSMLNNTAGLRKIRFHTKKTTKQLLNFGKFSIVTLISSNVLKSSDSFLIGLMMTSVEVAIYSIPIKLIEIFEIPLRSFIAVALPQISKVSRQNNENEVRTIFYKYTGILTVLFIPLIIILFIFSHYFILLAGGSQYVETEIPTTIFRVFLIYVIFIAIDRFSGVTLDSINRPRSNMIKSIVMVVVNILGDFIAIYYFRSLTGVAIATVLNSISGVFIGMHFLKKEVNIRIIQVPKTGINFFSNSITSYYSKLKSKKTY